MPDERASRTVSLTADLGGGGVAASPGFCSRLSLARSASAGERSSSAPAGTLDGALLVPLGLAAALVVAGTLTAFTATAPAAVTVVARRRRRGAGARLAADGGRAAGRCWRRSGCCSSTARRCCSPGKATFTGFIKLDDTATWFNMIDNVMSHGRSVARPAAVDLLAASTSATSARPTRSGPSCSGRRAAR